MTAATGVRTRRARPADSASIAAVMRSAIRRLAGPFHSARQIAAWSSLPPLYHAWAMGPGGERYVVAEGDGRIRGYAAIRRGEVTAVFVDPSWARRGIGRALLARLERDAAARGVRALRVLAASSAAPFYSSAGWLRGARIRVPLPGGGALPAFEMRKRLPRAGAAPRRARPSGRAPSPRPLPRLPRGGRAPAGRRSHRPT